MNFLSTVAFRVAKSGNRNCPGPETIRPNWSIVTKVNPERHMLDHPRSNFLSFHASGYVPHVTNWLGESHGNAPPIWFPSSSWSMAKSTVWFEVARERV